MRWFLLLLVCSLAGSAAAEPKVKKKRVKTATGLRSVLRPDIVFFNSKPLWCKPTKRISPSMKANSRI